MFSSTWGTNQQQNPQQPQQTSAFGQPSAFSQPGEPFIAF
jgi:hypothetical protein